MPDNMFWHDFFGSHFRGCPHAQLSKNLHPQLLLREIEKQIPAGARNAIFHVSVRKTSSRNNSFIVNSFGLQLLLLLMLLLLMWCANWLVSVVSQMVKL